MFTVHAHRVTNVTASIVEGELTGSKFATINFKSEAGEVVVFVNQDNIEQVLDSMAAAMAEVASTFD